MPDPNTAENQGAPRAGRRPPEAWRPGREQLDACLHEILANPQGAAGEMACLRHDITGLQNNCLKAAEAVDGMTKMVTELLEPKASLFHLERITWNEACEPRAVVNMNGQLREMPIAEQVDIETLEHLQPWELVKIHPTELIVVGVDVDDSLHGQALGETGTFENYLDRDRGLVTVSQLGRSSQIVALAPSLRSEELKYGDQLVLQRDNPRWAIHRIPGQRVASKFELPLSCLTTRLENLAGLGGVASRIIEDWIARLIRKEVTEMFELEPLNGMILYSAKAGMGKTRLAEALILWLLENGRENGYDVVPYSVEPNAMKSMWHGEDARIVRDELLGTIRARIAQPRKRPLIIPVLFDELESLGKRACGNDVRGYVSSAQNDAVQALLAGMDGIQPLKSSEGPPVEVLWWGLTNRLDGVDEALKRPGRMGGLVVEMPDYDADAAAEILQVYARGRAVPWYLDGEVRQGVSDHEVYERILRPAVAMIYSLPVLRYMTEQQRWVDVTAGEILAGAHYRSAMSAAKRRAAMRKVRRVGAPAVGLEDVADAVLDEARSLAHQLDTDRQMLERQLRLRIQVLRTDLIPQEQLVQHRYVRPV